MSRATARTALAWDYTEVASAYLLRPGYAPAAIEDCLRIAGLGAGMRACDVGAGTGNLTLPLLAAGLEVIALEPNAAMRRHGVRRTLGRARVRWHAARAEATALRAASCDLVAFGSSFNVVDRPAALLEASRLLRPDGWLVCLWNHRRLDDPMQQAIEALIRSHVPSYDPGARRADQAGTIAASRLFAPARRLEGEVVHVLPRDGWLEAWRAHLTLVRQAGDRMPALLGAMRALLQQRSAPTLEVVYTTRLWMARKRGR